MDCTCCFRILFVLFPAYVTCLGNYEGSMPTANLQRVSAHTFPEVIGPEVKQMGNWNDPVYASAAQPHCQDIEGSYDDAHEDRLFAGSNIKSDSKDCQTSGKSDNQDNYMINYKPSASVPKYDLSGFGRPSVQYESPADAFKKASTSSQSGPALMRVPSRGDSSYEMAGSNEIFVVKPLKNLQSHKYEVTRDPLQRGPNHASTSISSPVSHQYTSSKGSQSTSKLQTASSSYGPFTKGNPVYSRTNPINPSGSGFKSTQAKPFVVSSGPIVVVQGGGNAQGLGGYSGHPDSVKPFRGPSRVDPYQASKIYRLTTGNQGKSWNEPLRYSTSGTQYSPSSEPRKPSKNDCRDNDARYSIASSGGILLKAPERAQISKTPPHYEATHPKYQQTYDVHGQPNHISKPFYPSQSGDQHDVPKSSIASSGAILMMQAPENVQNRAESNNPKVYPIPERKVPFASGQTSQYQSGYQAFPSVKGTQYKPSSVPSRPSTSKLRFGATNPTIDGSNEINTVRVLLNKRPTSSFGSLQNQWASGDISRGAFQSSLPPSYPGQRPGQNVQKPVSSSSCCSKGVQSQDGTRRITAISNEFGQGTIQRTLSSSQSDYYRQAEQNQPQVNSLDSLASKCEVTHNSPAGFGQQGPVRFQEENLSI